jgi:hypothetical protein
VGGDVPAGVGAPQVGAPTARRCDPGRAKPVVEAWNAIAEQHGWRKTRGLGETCRLITTSLHRKSFEEHWEEALAWLEIHGLQFVGQGAGQHRHWRPNIEWFCRPRTVEKILDGEYSGAQAGQAGGKSMRDLLREAVGEGRGP